MWGFCIGILSNIMNNEEKELEIRQAYLKNKIRGTYLIAEYLTKKYDIVTVGTKQRETFVYQNGYYTRAENELIMPEIQRVLGDLVNKNAKTETFHKIQDMTSHKRDIFEEAEPGLIPVKNGVYNVMTDELLPHDSKYRFKYQTPVVYNKQATCPKIDKFFDQVFTETQRTTVEEWIGYCFYRNYMYKKALIIVGEGDTGKTTFLELLTALIGEENKSGISLHKIAGDKFAAAQLYEKHVNIFDELSADDVHDTANFKIATGGGSIMGEYKFGDQFSFRNFSKLMFACNRIPDVKDMNDEAYFNRWMVVHLEKTIPVKISNFIKTLTTEEELSGLFNVAMEGLRRLLNQDGFSYKNSGIDTKLEMMRSASALANFVTEKLQKDQGAEISKEEMYKAYQDFCDDRALAPETMIAVGKKLPFYAQYVQEARISTLENGKYVQVRGWRNVSIKLNDEQLQTKKENEEFANSLMAESAELINKRNEAVIVKAS